MKILDSCAQLTSRLEAEDEARIRSLSAQRISAATSKLDEPTTRLANIAEGLAVLSRVTPTAWKPQPHVERLAGHVRELVDQMRALLHEDAEAITKGKTLTTLSTQVQKIGDELSSDLRAAWSEVVATLPAANPASLRALELAPDAGNLAHEIRAANDRLKALSSEPPSSQEDWDRVDQARRRLADLLKKAAAHSDMPASVIHFLAGVNGRGASYQDLTDEVVTWLRDHDYLHKVRIFLRQE